MPERFERVLKMACIGLAVLVLIQLGMIAARINPLGHATVPALPALTAGPDEAKGGAKGTNSGPGQASGNAGTNSVALAKSGGKGTNPVARPPSGKAETNAVPLASVGKAETNTVAVTEPEKKETNSVSTGEPVKTGTNPLADGKAKKAAQVQASGKGETNAANPVAIGKKGSGRSAGKKGLDLAPPVLARVDRITDSEILGPVIRPLPMALLGIAGNLAFLRAPTGQTGMVKEGEDVGGIKLLRIGINRVLIEQEGQKKELTMFSGYGSESLLPKQKENP